MQLISFTTLVALRDMDLEELKELRDKLDDSLARFDASLAPPTQTKEIYIEPTPLDEFDF